MDQRLAVALLLAGAFLALASSLPAQTNQYSSEMIEELRMVTLDRSTGEVACRLMQKSLALLILPTQVILPPSSPHLVCPVTATHKN